MSNTIAIFIAGCSTIGIVVMVFQARHACRERALISSIFAAPTPPAAFGNAQPVKHAADRRAGSDARSATSQCRGAAGRAYQARPH